MNLERYTYKDLLNNPPPPTEWVVPGLIPEGVTVVAGPPKIGKSFFALQLATNVSQGKDAFFKFPTNKGKVFYFALEDSPTRIYKRLLAQDLATPEDDVEYIHRCAVGEIAIKQIEDLIIECPDTKLILIDTLEKIRGPRTTANMYEADYTSVGPFQELALHYHIAIMFFHHVRKFTTENIEESVSGSYGLTGAADALFIISRDVSIEFDAKLFINGRDVERTSFGMTFDADYQLWTMHGEVTEEVISPERQAILNVLKEKGELTPKAITDLTTKNPTELDYNLTRQILGDMVKAGQIRRPSRGIYCIA